MKIFPSRRGSALLIVLGMLSFMVISGLAFAAYMRATRLPSSFTRRTSTTRQLAKAAVAEAIDEIDRAIGNDPHPGVRVVNTGDSDNYWIGRVMLSDDATDLQEDKYGNTNPKPARDVESELKSDSEGDGGCAETVPVLSLEGLAYIPPPLVNEARYYGQRTPTAAWHSFDFDAGRYAFVALDVSDYFDVNRVLANEARSSNPARRVNIAHLFEGGGAEHTSKPTAAAVWETFMDAYRSPQDDGTIQYDGKFPFVSLADLNLAIGERTFGSFASPFVQYLKNSSGNGFYNAFPDSDPEEWDAYSRMTFVTDSFAVHGEKANGTTTFDLDSDEGQPYSQSYLDEDPTARSASSVLDDNVDSRKPWTYLKDRISACGMLALCDYLDRDDIPTSLAIPTAERVPMVCAVRPMPSGLKVVISREYAEKSANEVIEKSRDLEMTVTYRYRLAGELNVDAWTAFPFRDRVGFKDSYKADCRVAMFLSSEEMRLRTSDPRQDGDLLRAPNLSANGLKNGIVNLFMSGQSCPTKTVSKPEDAVKQMDGFVFEDAATVFTGDNAKGIKLFDATFVCKQTWDEDRNAWIPTPSDDNCVLKAAPTCDFSPIQQDGALDADFAKTITGNKAGTSISGLNLPAGTLRFNLATWIAVRNSEGKAVDLVPACMSDDRAYNGMNYEDDFTDGVFDKVSGVKAPLLKFAEPAGSAEIAIFNKADFRKASSSQEHEITLAQKEGIVVRDPRYNYAPENWFAAGSTINASGQYWLDNTGCADEDCDGDIFMATSDQEKMQSIGEIAFVPRFTNLNDYPSDRDVGNRIGNPEREWTDYPAKGSEAQANMMWRTFDPFDGGVNGYGFKGPDDKNSETDASRALLDAFRGHGRGVRVNPYSDSADVIMAAFANTPVSWRVASDNDDDAVNTVASEQTDVSSFNGKYAWNAYNTTGYRISWADLEDVAEKFRDEVRAAANTVDGVDSWKPALLDMFADHRADNETKLCGIELEESGRFYSVDKKTLWGFWQNAFEPQQQLFLVFVRAEPMMLGGGVAGVTPPQLGAKAVALVWRNPFAPKGKNDDGDDTSYIPHQTRILFYRQFE